MFDFIFPKECFVCKKQGNYLCDKCKRFIQPCRFQYCPVCKRASIWGTHRRCKDNQSADGLISLFRYQKPLTQMVKDFKYHQLKELKDLLAILAVEEFKKNKPFSFFKNNNFVFTPIPLFPVRKLWRGFNQSEVLLKVVCQKLNLRFKEVLRRTKWTREQAMLGKNERKDNLKNVFEVIDLKAVKNKNFVVFDDVYTSGNTLKEAVKILKSNRAKQVWGMTLCR